MAGRIPQSFIDELLNRTDIVEVIDARVPLKKAGREYKACCPFHGEKTPSFTVSQVKQFYHCFGCGEHGTAITFLMDYEHMEFVEAIEELARRAGLEVPREAGIESHTPSTLPHYALLERVSEYYQAQLREHPQSGRAVAYLKNRGLSGEVAARFHIGFAPPGWENLAAALGADDKEQQLLLELGLTIKRDDGNGAYDRFRDRIQFPIHDRRGRTIGFGGRVLDDSTPKYLNSPESPVFHKGKELYGLFEARKAIRHLERILVVEGYMDVVALAQFDINYTVATLGTATTHEHLEHLFRAVPEVVFCFDGDRAGKAAAWRALENALPQVREGRQMRFVFLPDRHDPDSFVNEHGADAFIEALDNGVALSDFLIGELSSQVDMTTVDGKARLAELAKPLIHRIPDGVYRELLLERLADTVGISATKLEKMIGHASESGGRTTGQTKLRARRRRGNIAAGRPSVVRRAITLLLNSPKSGDKLDIEKLAGVNRPGVELLHDLIETVQEEPNITTAGLLERWRHDDEGRHLGKLAAVPLPEEDDFDPAAELEACLDQLAVAGRRERIDFLIEKQKLNSLTDDERSELRQLH